MTGKERTMRALRREKTDRPPTDLTCTPEIWQALREHFGVSTDIDVLNKMDVDMVRFGIPFIGPKERSTPPLGGEGYDFWGVYNKEIKNSFNTYYDFVGHPLANMETVDEIMAYDWPSLDWWDYSKVKETIRSMKGDNDRCIMWFAGGAFETPWYMRGLEQFLIDLYDAPEIVDAICFKVAEYYRERAMRVLNEANGEIDMIGSGGDIGGQNCMMLSPEKWRELIKPHSASLIRPFKDMGFGTFYHSCGSCYEVIDDLIEIGLDVLDPIQVTAANMQPEILYPKFGDRLSFHGAIDEVELLPHATPQEVYDETQRIISILGGNYGYIVSPSHQVQGDTSVENVLAIFQAARDYKY